MKRPDIAIIAICVLQAVMLFIAFAAGANGAPFPWLGALIAIAGSGLLVYSTTDLRTEKIALWFATAGAAILWVQLGPTAYFAVQSLIISPSYFGTVIFLIPVFFLLWISVWVVSAHIRMRKAPERQDTGSPS